MMRRYVAVPKFLIFALSSPMIMAQTDGTDGEPGSNNNLFVEEIVVTTTREAKGLNEITESIGVLTEEELRFISPSHPAEALNRIAGVHINNLGGEGHMASIRQPISTAGVYLFLEDGLPSRPTGFFNHNGLYEINIPQSSRLEVIKGPGSALYGSDAIGGVINVITKAAPTDSEVELNLEGGSDGWQRGLLTLGGGGEALSGRLDVNVTDSDGFRDESAYTRESYTGRIDSQLNDRLQMKLIGAFSTIDQSGTSGLEIGDFRNDSERNDYHDDIGFRQVDALRVSAELDYIISDTQLFSITPFYRDNTMTMMPSWMVTYDPNIRDYEFQSYGALIKYRQRLFDDSLEVIVGTDIDSTPSEYLEEEIAVTVNDGIYTDYMRTGTELYRFDADQRSVSPYIHTELRLGERWRLNAGVRHDIFRVDYDNMLENVPFDFAHLKPEDMRIEYENTSPKFGVLYQFSDNHHAYVNHRYAFRAPTVGSLFRPGSSRNTTELDPVTSVSSEIGFRGQFADRFQYEFAVYDMTTDDDIVSVIDGNSRVTTNAGETRHRGVELGLDLVLSEEWQLGASMTRTRQTYEDFNYVFFSRACFCNQEINFAGNDVARAPEFLGNVRLAYTPLGLQGLRAELEWENVGDYYTDQTNTQKYGGHDLVNLRLAYQYSEDISFYVRGANLTDKRYSTYTSNQVNDPDISYRPGMPRSWFVGLRWAL